MRHAKWSLRSRPESYRIFNSRHRQKSRPTGDQILTAPQRDAACLTDTPLLDGGRGDRGH